MPNESKRTETLRRSATTSAWRSGLSVISREATIATRNVHLPTLIGLLVWLLLCLTMGALIGARL